MKALEKLLRIDTRVMYGLLCLIIVVLLVKPVEMPLSTTLPVQGAFDAVQAIPADKIAIISIVWSSSTMAENRTQTEAIMRHMFRRGVRFAIISWDQQGAKLAYDSAEKLSRELHKRYGVDWCDWGYRPALFSQILPGLAKDVAGQMRKDRFGTPIASVPMMRRIKDIDDVALVVEVTPSKTVDAWIMFIQGVHGTPIVYCPTLVQAPEAFNYLDARQVVGMLPGLPGAGQYEKLLEYEGFGQTTSTALSGSHLLIVILIILGNIGLLAQRRRRQEGGQAE